jgi:hypothetical protein
MGGMARFGAFGADGVGGSGLLSGGTAIQAAGSVLGSDHDRCYHAILAGGRLEGFLAASFWNGDRGRGWCDRGESVWGELSFVRD